MILLDRRRLLALLAAAAAPARAFAADLAELPGAVVAPDFALPDLDGRTHRLSGLRGRPVVVNFWAVWCAPCRRELGTLADLQQRLRGDGIAVFAVDLGDPADRVAAFLADHAAPDLTVLLDRDKSAATAWHVQGLPVTFVLDRAGILRLGALGERDWRTAAIERQLRALM